MGNFSSANTDQDKIAVIFLTTFSNAPSWIKLYEFRLQFVSKGEIDNIPSLVQIMAWHRLGYKTTNDDKFIDTYIRHSASVG